MALTSHYHTVGHNLINAIETIQRNITQVIEWELRCHIQHGANSSLSINELDDFGNIAKHAHMAHVRILEGYHGRRGPFEWDFEACWTLNHVIETSSFDHQELNDWMDDMMDKLVAAIVAAEDLADEEVSRLKADAVPF